MKRALQFFSSVKLAIVLIILLAAASILGTLIPQGRGPEEYAARFGALAGPLAGLKLFGLYHSVWYLTLLLFLGLNIVVCTLVRLGGKLRRALHPRIAREAREILALKSSERFKKAGPPGAVLPEIEGRLKSARYRVRSSVEGPRTHLLARKRIAGIFGADAVHAGLLVILAGGLVSGLAGFHRDLAMNEGDVAPVPKAAFALRLDKFSTLYYPDGSVKAWISAVTFLESGKPVRSGNIQVNRPLSYKGFSFYQTSYGWNWDTASIEVWVRKKTDPAFLKKLKIRAGEGAALGDREGTTLAVRRFIPDFVLGANNEPETRSNELKNPAAYLEAQRGKDKIFSGWVFANFPDFAQTHAGGAKDPAGVPDWLFELKNFEAGAYSVLEAARDPGAAIIWFGCALVMAGLGLAFYWPTWEIQAVLEDGQGRTEVVLGGLAAKSREAFGAEFESIAAALRKAK